MHWNILDEARKDLLPALSFAKGAGFYLAGGTGLALQIGHRDSIDFDFFKEGSINPNEVFALAERALNGHKVVVVQNEPDTLTLLVDGSIKMSFFGYGHTCVAPLVTTEHIDLASLRDIGCMKLAAITGRSLEKDYIDLYFLLQSIALSELLADLQMKIPVLDETMVLKALVYFDDVTREPILFKENHNVTFETVQEFLRQHVKEYYKKL